MDIETLTDTIARRIEAEHRKHSHWGEEWNKIAAAKIVRNLILDGIIKEK